MKTSRERARDWLINMTENEMGLLDSIESLEKLLKEQDKITRGACAEAVSSYPSHMSAQEACMNVKAV